MTTVRLLALQEIDSAIDRLTARRATLEGGGALAEAREQADAAERRLGEFRLKLDELGRDQMRFEHEIDSMSQKEQAEQTRLYDGSIANAKELEALQHDIENLKKRRSDREDELLVILEQREALEAGASEAQQVSESLRATVDEVAGASAADLAATVTELEQRTAERTSIASEIDPELLELYEDLRAQKKGVGAATLVDGVCQGCHEQLSAMQLDKLKKTEGVRRCEHCRRILVF
jgi:predicted  nucleic acid-binding Zn-ribbon protein